MSALWLSILTVALASAAIKAAGPVIAGGRKVPEWASSVITLLAPALVAAMVVTETFGEDGRLVLDARAVGVAVAAVALALRAPVLVAVALAVMATATVRAFG